MGQRSSKRGVADDEYVGLFLGGEVMFRGGKNDVHVWGMGGEFNKPTLKIVKIVSSHPDSKLPSKSPQIDNLRIL